MEEGASCVICHDDILSQAACALRCGHVYHSHCVQQWFANEQPSKSHQGGCCPQCKAPSGGTDGLRHIIFEVAALQPQSMEEVLQLQAMSADEQNQLREECALQREEVTAQKRLAEMDLEELQNDAKENKRIRKKTERGFAAFDSELNGLQKQRDDKKVATIQQRVQMDERLNRQMKKLPVGKSRDPVLAEDPDAREERRRLMSMRPAERARQLHDALASAKQQETEANRAALESRMRADDVDRDLKQVRQREVHLRRQLSELRDAAPLTELRRESLAGSSQPSQEPRLHQESRKAGQSRIQAMREASQRSLLVGQSSQEAQKHPAGVRATPTPVRTSLGAPSATPPVTPPASAASSAATSSSGGAPRIVRSSTGGSDASGPGGGGVGEKRSLDVAAGPGVKRKAVEEDDGADVLYGMGAPPRKRGGVGVLARSTPILAATNKAATATSFETTGRKPPGMKMSLF